MKLKKIIELIVFFVSAAIFLYVARPKIALLLYSKGCDYYDERAYDKALFFFGKSLLVNPDSPDARRGLADVFNEKGIQDEAIAGYQKIIHNDSFYVPAYFALARIYRSKHMYDEAILQLKQAQKIAPQNNEIKILKDDISFEYVAECLDKGSESFLSGDKEKAYSLVSRAIEINPAFAFSYYTLAQFYLDEGRYEDAEGALKKAVRLDFKLWAAHKLLGDIYFDKREWKEAIAAYKNALVLNPLDMGINNDLGIALMNEERYGEAVIYLREASSQDPGNLKILYNLASVSRDNNMLEDALDGYNKVVQEQPDYPNVHNDLADIYIRLKQGQKAQAEYNKEIEYSQKRLAVNPGDPDALNNFSYALCGIGEYDKAKEVIEELIKSRPDYRQAYFTLARIHEKTGNSQQAIVILEKAKELSREANFISDGIKRIEKEQIVKGQGN